MSRLNPRRRRFVKQAALIQAIVHEHGPSHDDSAKLQQGKVDCALSRRQTAYTLTPPREKSLEGAGRLGKIVKGKFVPAKPGSKQRFSLK